MSHGADQLHPALMGLVVGLRSLEARQEGVLDVDAASEEFRREGTGQDLYVACQHDEIGSRVIFR